MISRRQFAALVLACAVPRAFSASAQTQPAGRNLDFEIGDGFGEASAADIEAVIRSAADSIWKHCPNTHWEEHGFYVYHSSGSPITLDDHRPDGRIAIGLTSTGNYWSQYAFQFAHEFCHSLAGHSNDWHKPWIHGRKPNLWLEESFCETASVFALRAMGQSWQSSPPYPNWKDYAPKLTQYAADRITQTWGGLPHGEAFIDWYHKNEPAMRQNPVLRPRNNVVASMLLPIFEAIPSGWEAISFFNLGRRDPEESLAVRFANWMDNLPSDQKPFVSKVASLFGL